MPAYFDTGVIVGEQSWHGLELELDWAGGLLPRGEKITVREAMERSGMIYEVVKIPLTVNLPDGTVYRVGHKQEVMRPPTVFDPEWAHLRTVANRYEVLQNEKLAEIMDLLSDEMPVESVISLKGGQITVVELRAEPFEVGGQDRELHETFLMASNDHAEGGLFWGLTGVRIVCANTYAMSLGADKGRGNIINIPHTAGGVNELEFRAAMLDLLHSRQQQEKEFLNTLFARKVSGEEVNGVVRAVFPDVEPGRAMRVVESALPQLLLSVDPDDPEFYDKALEEVDEPRIAKMLKKAQREAPTFQSNYELNEKRRQELADNFVKFGDEQPYAGDTAYALFQAVTETITHSDTFTGSTEKNVISQLFGQKNTMIQRGREALVEVLK